MRPKRVVRNRHSHPTFVRHAGQNFVLSTQSRTWAKAQPSPGKLVVWVADAVGDTPGFVPDLLLYDGPSYDAHVIGRAAPVTRNLTAHLGHPIDEE